ncbi:alpha/beta hydrolase fold [Ectopseudomonas composti]|uniref:Alpha/beta hydrolase fold n=1 Tax=Ectopseudomonas composti TaxID=658457 RepID=A0A1I5QMK3_9GAMM|nr:alpha/beta fold hydrolase [Pseudomonas composti]SFP47086.1 alpha/beta hydrolase fold [Pseudomonas composti]
MTRTVRLAGMALLTLLVGCATRPTPEDRAHSADRLAAKRDWAAQTLEAKPFQLRAYLPKAAADDTLVIYLEGDGFAWLTSTRPSADPTPLTPVALQLALAQPSGAAAYLARPCQFIATQPACSRDYWTDARFAPEVVSSLDQAADQLKTRVGAQQLILVGYSGGGALALLLAARRDDVARVVTVAGNLDPQAWTTHHRLQPLKRSLNPADQRLALAGKRQQHLVGGRDRIVPAVLASAFNDAYPPDTPSRVYLLPEHDHACCWARDWPSLWLKLQQDAQASMRDQR